MIITICGSMSKYKLMCNIASKLMSSLKDTIVLIPEIYNTVLFNTDDYKKHITDIEYDNLFNTHKLKIDICDIVLIIDYEAGDGTYKELEYAKNNNKEIILLSEIIRYFSNDDIIMKEIKGE